MTKWNNVRSRVVAASVAGLVLMSVVTDGASAAEIPDPVIDITVSPENPRIGERIRTDVSYCVPDSTVQGDTFQVELPPELTFLPDGFPVNEPGGGPLVASATIAGSPAVVTFTFTDYVDTRTGVCGDAFFESFFDQTLTVGEERRLVYTVNGAVDFDPVITPRPSLGVDDGNVVGKGGFFTDVTDECRTSLDSCIQWHIRSRIGPFDQVVIDDPPIPGIRFECDQVEVTLREVQPDGELGAIVSPGDVGATALVECTDGVTATVDDLPDGLIVRLTLVGTPDEPAPEGGRSYENVAVVTHLDSGVAVETDNVSVERRSSAVGGEASGSTPTSTTIAPAPTTTVLAPTTTTVLAPTTTEIGSGAATTTVAPSTTIPVAPILPPTGSNGALAATAAIALLAGLALVAVAARRTS